MAGTKRRGKSSPPAKSKPAKPGKAPAPPRPGSAAAAFGRPAPAELRVPSFVSRPGVKPERRPPPPKLKIDKQGRWRDRSGRFLSRETLFRDFVPGSFEDVGLYLQDLGERLLAIEARSKAPRATTFPRFLVKVRVAGVENDDHAWKMASNAHTLGAAVYQAGGRLRFSKKFRKASDEAKSQAVEALALAELPPSAGPMAKRKKQKGRKR